MSLKKFSFLRYNSTKTVGYILKKIVLFLLLISSLYSKSTIYMGLNAGMYNEKFDNINAKTSSYITELKIGYGDRKLYSIEFSIDFADNKSKIFSSSENTESDGNRFGFNIHLIKAFDLNIYALPFVKVGFGSGFLDIDRKLQKSLSYGQFSFGLGTLIPLGNSFDAEIGYEIRPTSYEEIDYIATKINYKSTTNVAYFGINYRY